MNYTLLSIGLFKNFLYTYSMSKNRSYEQVCPAAYALDVVGERWTLLILRELMHGARRFSDLQRCLPGLGANLLSQRLKKLEQFAVIRQRQLPPPAASSVYELTAVGNELRPVLGGLTRFGLHFLPMPPPESDEVTPNSLVGVSYTYFNAVAAEDTAVTIEFHLDGDVVFVSIVNGSIRSGYGLAPTPTDLILKGSARTFFLLIAHELTLADVLPKLEFSLGDASLCQTVLDCFLPGPST
jgi:DNA-binding HxlR family transcriptional regulator